MQIDVLRVDERYRFRDLGSRLLRKVERIAREKGCRVVTLGTASFMTRPFYENHGCTVFTTLKKANGYISYSPVKYPDRETPIYVPTANCGAHFRLSFGNDDDAKGIVNGIHSYSEAYEPECESFWIRLDTAAGERCRALRPRRDKTAGSARGEISLTKARDTKKLHSHANLHEKQHNPLDNQSVLIYYYIVNEGPPYKLFF